MRIIKTEVAMMKLVQRAKVVCVHAILVEV